MRVGLRCVWTWFVVFVVGLTSTTLAAKSVVSPTDFLYGTYCNGGYNIPNAITCNVSTGVVLAAQGVTVKLPNRTIIVGDPSMPWPNPAGYSGPPAWPHLDVEPGTTSPRFNFTEGIFLKLAGLTMTQPISGSNPPLSSGVDLRTMILSALLHRALLWVNSGYQLVLTNVSVVLPDCRVLAALRSRICYERLPGTVQVLPGVTHVRNITLGTLVASDVFLSCIDTTAPAPPSPPPSPRSPPRRRPPRSPPRLPPPPRLAWMSVRDQQLDSTPAASSALSAVSRILKTGGFSDDAPLDYPMSCSAVVRSGGELREVLALANSEVVPAGLTWDQTEFRVWMQGTVALADGGADTGTQTQQPQQRQVIPVRRAVRLMGPATLDLGGMPQPFRLVYDEPAAGFDASAPDIVHDVFMWAQNVDFIGLAPGGPDTFPMGLLTALGWSLGIDGASIAIQQRFKKIYLVNLNDCKARVTPDELSYWRTMLGRTWDPAWGGWFNRTFTLTHYSGLKPPPPAVAASAPDPAAPVNLLGLAYPYVATDNHPAVYFQDFTLLLADDPIPTNSTTLSTTPPPGGTLVPNNSNPVARPAPGLPPQQDDGGLDPGADDGDNGTTPPDASMGSGAIHGVGLAPHNDAATGEPPPPAARPPQSPGSPVSIPGELGQANQGGDDGVEGAPPPWDVGGTVPAQPPGILGEIGQAGGSGKENHRRRGLRQAPHGSPAGSLPAPPLSPPPQAPSRPQPELLASSLPSSPPLASRPPPVPPPAAPAASESRLLGDWLMRLGAPPDWLVAETTPGADASGQQDDSWWSSSWAVPLSAVQLVQGDIDPSSWSTEFGASPPTPPPEPPSAPSLPSGPGPSSPGGWLDFTDPSNPTAGKSVPVFIRGKARLVSAAAGNDTAEPLVGAALRANVTIMGHPWSPTTLDLNGLDSVVSLRTGSACIGLRRLILTNLANGTTAFEVGDGGGSNRSGEAGVATSHSKFWAPAISLLAFDFNRRSDAPPRVFLRDVLVVAPEGEVEVLLGLASDLLEAADNSTGLAANVSTIVAQREEEALRLRLALGNETVGAMADLLSGSEFWIDGNALVLARVAYRGMRGANVRITSAKNIDTSNPGGMYPNTWLETVELPPIPSWLWLTPTPQPPPLQQSPPPPSARIAASPPPPPPTQPTPPQPVLPGSPAAPAPAPLSRTPSDTPRPPNQRTPVGVAGQVAGVSEEDGGSSGRSGIYLEPWQAAVIAACVIGGVGIVTAVLGVVLWRRCGPASVVVAAGPSAAVVMAAAAREEDEQEEGLHKDGSVSVSVLSSLEGGSGSTRKVRSPASVGPVALAIGPRASQFARATPPIVSRRSSTYLASVGEQEEAELAEEEARAAEARTSGPGAARAGSTNGGTTA